MNTGNKQINKVVPRRCFKFTRPQKQHGPRVRTLQESKYKKPSKEVLEKYFIKRWSTTADIMSKDMFLAFRIFTKCKMFERSRKLRSLPLLQRYRRVQVSLQLRLHMPPASDEMHAITDVDKHFFTLLENIPRGGSVAKYKTLKVQYSRYLNLRIDTAFILDCILNIDSNMRREQKIFNRASEQCKESFQFFNSFVAEDYKKSTMFMKRSLDSESKLTDKEIEMHQLAEQSSHFNAELVVLDYKLRLQQKYGRFLYYISPSQWRAHHREFARSIDIELRGFDLGTASGFDSFAELSMQNEFKNGNLKAELYFSEPEDLLDVFDNVAKRNLHYFLYVTEVLNLTTSCKHQVETLKRHIHVESYELSKCLQEYEMLLLDEELKVQEQEKEFYRLLKGVFHETVCSKEVLKLFVHLEFCTEFVAGFKPLHIGMPIVAMGKYLEEVYMEYMGLLELVSGDKIKKAMAESVELQRMAMSKAELARRDLRFINRLRENLQQAFEPPKPRPKLPIAQLVQSRSVTRHRVAPLPLMLTHKRPKERIITQDEKDYVMFFTDWVRGEDPMLYLRDKCQDVF